MGYNSMTITGSLIEGKTYRITVDSETYTLVASQVASIETSATYTCLGSGIIRSNTSQIVPSSDIFVVDKGDNQLVIVRNIASSSSTYSSIVMDMVETTPIPADLLPDLGGLSMSDFTISNVDPGEGSPATTKFYLVYER
jgi:hypothetical protein